MAGYDPLAYNCEICNTHTFNYCNGCKTYVCNGCNKHVLNNIYVCGNCKSMYVDMNVYDIDELAQTSEKLDRDLCCEILRLRDVNARASATNTQLFAMLQEARDEVKLLRNHIDCMPDGKEQIKLLDNFNKHKEQLESLRDQKLSED